MPPLDRCSSLFPSLDSEVVFLYHLFSTITAPTCCLPDHVPSFPDEVNSWLFVTLPKLFNFNIHADELSQTLASHSLRIIFSTDLALHHITLTSSPSLDLAITNNSNALLNTRALHSLSDYPSYLFSSSSPNLTSTPLQPLWDPQQIDLINYPLKLMPLGVFTPLCTKLTWSAAIIILSRAPLVPPLFSQFHGKITILN